MPVTYTFENGMLTLVLAGDVNPTEVIEAIEGAKKKPSFRPGMPMLVDGRQALAPSASDVRLLVGRLRDSPAPRVGRVAVVIQGLASFGMARMAQILLSGTLDMLVTYNEDEARIWLAQGLRTAAWTAPSNGLDGSGSNEESNPEKRGPD